MFSRLEVLGVAVLIGSLTVNVALGLAVVSGPQPTLEVPAGVFLEAGDRMEALIGQDLAGASRVIEFRGNNKSTLLYIDSSACRWCARNERNLIEVVAAAAGGLRTVIAFIDEPNGAAASGFNRKDVEVIQKLTHDQIQRLRLSATPQTFLVDSTGVIKEAWYGAYIGQTASSIEGVFHIALSGLTHEPALPVVVPAHTSRMCIDRDGRTFAAGFQTSVNGQRVRCARDGSWEPTDVK